MTKVNTNGVIRKSIIYVWEKKSSSPDVCEANRPGYGGGGPGGQKPEDKKRIREAEMRKLYANSWAVELMKAPCARPGLHVRDILFSLRCLATEKKTNVRVVARIHVLQRGIVHFWTLRRAE